MRESASRLVSGHGFSRAVKTGLKGRTLLPPALAQAERCSERSRYADFRPLPVPRELTIACRNK
jgi:hypothetical protein